MHGPHLHADVEEPNIPDSVWLGPKPYKDGTASNSYAPVRAVEDGLHKIWLWSPATVKEQFRWRLAGPVRIEEDNAPVTLYPLEGNAPAISLVVALDASSLAVAVAGVGLYQLAVDEPLMPGSIKRMAEPDNESFRYLDTLFHDGRAWHAISTPQPADYEIRSSDTLRNRALISYIRHYDTSKPTDTLWRLAAVIQQIERKQAKDTDVKE